MRQKPTGINKLRTALKARTRSMPKQEGQEHLDIYLAQKRLERLQSERENADLRSQRIDKEFAELSARVGKLQGELGVASPAAPAATGQGRAKKKPRPMANMKTMDLSY